MIRNQRESRESKMARMMLSLAISLVVFLLPGKVFSQKVERPTYREGDFWHFRVIEMNPKTLETDSTLPHGEYEIAVLGGKVRVFKLKDGVRGGELGEGRNLEELERQLRESLESQGASQEIERLGQEHLRGQGEEQEAVLAMNWALSHLGLDNFAIRALDFPLFVGKKWNARYRLPILAGKEVWATADHEVSGTEEVRTEAGTFQTLKIERRIRTWVGTPQIDIRTTSFYGPEARSVVRSSLSIAAIQRRRETELIKFGSAR